MVLLREPIPVVDPWLLLLIMAGKGGYVPRKDLLERSVAELFADRVYSAGRFFFSLRGFGSLCVWAYRVFNWVIHIDKLVK